MNFTQLLLLCNIKQYKQHDSCKAKQETVI